MLDKKDLGKIRRALEKQNKGWLELNNQARVLIKITKQMIYAIHRGDLKKAHDFNTELEFARKKLEKASPIEKHKYAGAMHNALQEYVEAVAYLAVIEDGRIPGMGELRVEPETYITGLSDLTGELMRKGIDYMIKEEYAKTVELKNAVSEIYSGLLSLDLPTGETRKKADQIKYNLSRLEEKIYDAKIRGKI